MVRVFVVFFISGTPQVLCRVPSALYMNSCSQVVWRPILGPGAQALLAAPRKRAHGRPAGWREHMPDVPRLTFRILSNDDTPETHREDFLRRRSAV